MKLYRDTIAGLRGHPASGVCQLEFASGRTALIDGGYGVRQLTDAFDMPEGSGNPREKIVGQVIVWRYDESGLALAEFSPIDKWSGPDDFDENGELEYDPDKVEAD